MGRYISTTGTLNPVLRTVTTAYTAEVNDRILADTTSSAITITLPANASLVTGDQLQIIDVVSNFSTNNVTLARNSSKILGDTADLVLDVDGSVITLLYTGATYGWVLTSS